MGFAAVLICRLQSCYQTEALFPRSRVLAEDSLKRCGSEKHIPIDPSPITSPPDLRIYLTDSQKVQDEFGWSPKRNAHQIVGDIFDWVREYAELLRPILR